MKMKNLMPWGVCAAGALALLALRPSAVMAQRGWQIGMFALPQYSILFNETDLGSPAEVYSYRPTFGVGGAIVWGYGFTDNLGIRSQLLFSDQGQSNQFTALNNENRLQDYVRDLRLRYLKLPVLFRWNSNPEKKAAATFETGPQLEILVDEDEQTSLNVYQSFPPAGQTFTGYPRRMNTLTPANLGWVVAGGIDVKLRYNVKMSLQLRFDVAFLDAERKSAKFLLTENGVSREVNYYDHGIFDPAVTGEKRKASTNMTVGLAIGFFYVFIPRFHY